MTGESSRFSYCDTAMLTAEQLPVGLASITMNRYGARRNPAGILHSAWCHIEYALSPDCQDVADLKNTYFNYADDLLGEVINSPSSGQNIRFSALRLASFMPLFKKRVTYHNITQQDCIDLYGSLGAALSWIKPLHDDEPPQSSMYEAACESLSARSRQPEYILFPTSPREEASVKARFNHDSYFLNASNKLPIQQKLIATAKRYDNPVKVMLLEPIIERAAKRAKMELPDSRANKLNTVLSLVIREAHSDNISIRETQFLDCITRGIIAHYDPIHKDVA